MAALRSDPLQGRSLPAADRIFWRQTSSVLRALRLPANARSTQPLTAEAKTAAYRIVQEALTNICKYAIATAVEIELHTTPTQLEIRVQDNGQGFESQQNTTGFGLQGMRERTLALAGGFEVITAPGAGCCIVATFPLVRLEL